MKQPKRPTRKQKEIIANHKLNMRNWMVQEETPTHLVVVYKFGETVKKLDKSKNLWKEDKKNGICTNCHKE